jgi:nucleoside-diphosphate-sugar epimerase
MTTNRQGAEIVRTDGGIPVYAEANHRGEIKSMMKMANADVAIHLAPQAANEVPFLAGHDDPQALVEGTDAFVKAAEDAQARFLIHTSFAYLYGDMKGKTVDETAPLTHIDHPLLLAGRRAEKIAHDSSVPACILRAGYLYGPESKSLSALSTALTIGRPSIPVGKGENFANWIHVEDLASALVLAAEQHPADETFNIADDAPVTPGEFLAGFATALGLPPPGKPGLMAHIFPNKVATLLLGVSVKADNGKAKAHLGWTPKYPSCDSGIEQVLLVWRASMATRS